jgi:hypothetical protein
MRLTPDQISDLEELIDHTIEQELDSFDRDCLDCANRAPGVSKKDHEAAIRKLEEAREPLGGDSAEPLDALARLSIGHVYCNALRLSDRIGRHKTKLEKKAEGRRR